MIFLLLLGHYVRFSVKTTLFNNVQFIGRAVAQARKEMKIELLLLLLVYSASNRIEYQES
jgi:hypothetical protein